MRAALIGCGRIAKMHVSALQGAGVEIVAVCDRDPQRAADIAALTEGARVFTDTAALYAEARPDAVHILTPPATHAALAIEAAEAGCHALVEKPMALDTAEADRMIAAARANGVRLVANHNYLAKPSVAKARELIGSGAVGDVVYVDAYYGLTDEANSFAGPGGAHWAKELPGGPFTNFLPHLVYLQAEFLGGIESVDGVSLAGDPTADDPASELTVLLRGAGGRTTGAMAISMRARPYAKFVRIYGTEAIVHADLVSEVTTVHRNRRVPRLVSKALFNAEIVPQLTVGTIVNTAKVVTGSMRNMPDLHAFVRDLYTALEAGAPPPATGEDGRMVVEVMERIWDRMPAPPSPSPKTEDTAPRTAVEGTLAEAGGLAGKVLVTGASGFVGRHLVPALARAGADVRALVRDRTRVPDAVERHAEVLTGNLVDADVVARAMEGVDLVVHAAAVTTNNVAWRVHEETNIEGTRVVLEQARRAGVKRVVHLSSVIVYGVGATNGGGPVAESAALPQDVDRWAYYQRSKLAAEELARAAEGVEVVILRPGLLYGPGQESPVKRGLVQLGAARLTIGSGRNALPLTFVDNAVDAILLALTRPEAAGETFNVVDDDQPVAREAYRRAMTAAGDDVRLVPVPASLLSALGGWLESRAERADADTPPRVSRFQIASATRDMRYDTAKARTRLGWEPAVSLDEGLRRTFPAR